MSDLLADKVRHQLVRYEQPLFDFEARSTGEGVEVEIRYKPSNAEVHNYTFQLHPREIENAQFPWTFQKQLYDCLHDYIIEMFTRNPQPATRELMASRSEPTPLALLLAERIRSDGPITFAEYMDACLYHPLHGYYTKAEQHPRRDYFTSVDASPLFGRLLARQFQEMWVQLDRPAEFLLVELGAGTGALAAQILDFIAESFPEFYSAAQYVAVERSAARRTAAAATATLAPHLGAEHFAMVSDMPTQIPCGCVLSNEFFDALPVHRLIREGNEVREVYVGSGTNGLCEQFGDRK